jgi:hypothetical protein
MNFISFFKKNKKENRSMESNALDSCKMDQKIIKFEHATHRLLEKEVILIQKLVDVLSKQPVDSYEQTICACIQSMHNKPLSLKRLIKIILHNSTINPTTKNVLQLLPYASRENIIDQLASTWPHHKSLIERLRHISYLVHFYERKFPGKSFLCLMSKEVVAEFILEGKTSTIPAEDSN